MKFARTAIVLAAALGAGSAMAQDIQFSGGLKAWNHKFKVDARDLSGGGSETSNFNATSTLLSLTARKGDYFVTYSTLLPTTYALDGGDIKRQDTDIAVGWSFMPGYSVLLGQKVIKSKGYNTDRESWNADPSVSDKGMFLGLTGAQPLKDRLFLYESIAIVPKMKSSNQPSASTKFSTLEIGLGYALDTKTQLTLGYRQQVYKQSDSARNGFNQKVNLDGIIFGASVNF